MEYERITSDKKFDGPIRNSHEFRYRLANGFIDNKDYIIDAGCGVGYSRNFLNGTWFGVDINPTSERKEMIKGDLEELTEIKGLKEYDIFIGFEIMEHLNNYKNFVKLAKKAKKWIITSVPIVPTKHRNKYHKQDFEFDSLPKIFEDDDWKLYQAVKQNDLYGIYFFKRI